MLRYLTKYVFLSFGFLSLALGIVGAFLPLLPTIPFILLAAFCFSKGSKRLHSWLLNQKLFGRMIHDWEKHGIIQPRLKWVSTVGIILMLSYPIVFISIPLVIKILAGGVGACVIVFIQTRPRGDG